MHGIQHTYITRDKHKAWLRNYSMHAKMNEDGSFFRSRIHVICAKMVCLKMHREHQT